MCSLHLHHRSTYFERKYTNDGCYDGSTARTRTRVSRVNHSSLTCFHAARAVHATRDKRLYTLRCCYINTLLFKEITFVNTLLLTYFNKAF